MRLTELPIEELVRHLCRGRQKVREALAQGRAVPTWEAALAELEEELARRMSQEPATASKVQEQVQEVGRLLQEQGWVLVWSETLRDLIAFVENQQAAAQVPGGIVVYTRAELALVLGSDSDTKRLIHETKKHGARVSGARRQKDEREAS